MVNYNYLLSTRQHAIPQIWCSRRRGGDEATAFSSWAGPGSGRLAQRRRADGGLAALGLTGSPAHCDRPSASQVSQQKGTGAIEPPEVQSAALAAPALAPVPAGGFCSAGTRRARLRRRRRPRGRPYAGLGPASSLGVSLVHGVVARGRPAPGPRGDCRRPERGAPGPKNNGYNFSLAVVLPLVGPYVEQGDSGGPGTKIRLVNSTAYSQTVDSPSMARQPRITE